MVDSQIDLNSQTRADTYGMRPDIFHALSGNMVGKEDLGAAGGLLGYGSVRHDTGLPGDFKGANGEEVYITAAEQAFHGIRAELWEVTVPSAQRMGIRLLDSGVWLVLAKFSANLPSSAPASLRLAIDCYLEGGDVAGMQQTHYSAGGFVSFALTNVVVSENPNQILVPHIAAYGAAWTGGSLELSAFRMDRGGSIL